MAVPLPPTRDLPAGFAEIVESLRAVRVRPEVVLGDSPAPQRLAPYAVAVHGEVPDGDGELANGRLVILHDPAGQDVWEGDTRLVAYVRAALEPDIARDPLLPGVGWSWLIDALTATGADYRAIGGTVTRVSSQRFGALSQHPEAGEIELRASWSPGSDDLSAHLHAFAEVLCFASGLPPAEPGVVMLPPARRRTPRPRKTTGARPVRPKAR